PTCKRYFEASDIESKKEELTASFNKHKSERLANITKRGTDLKEQIAIAETDLLALENKLKEINTKIYDEDEQVNSIKKSLESTPVITDEMVSERLQGSGDYKSLDAEIKALEEQINAPAPEQDNEDLLEQRKALQTELYELKEQISNHKIREKTEARIEELLAQESTLSQELADLEGVDFAILAFEKNKMTELEERINSKFSLVKFKMFEEQINGGEVPTCVTLINGVPYPDPNTATKVQAGLDIINALSSHYDMYARVWIDNRESVTDIPETKSQIINLMVSPNHKSLTVQQNEAAAVA